MKRLVLLCLAVFLLHGGTAFAESEKCTALAKRFEEASKADVSSSRLKRATESRDKGLALCEEGRAAGGIRALKEALRLIDAEEEED